MPAKLAGDGALRRHLLVDEGADRGGFDIVEVVEIVAEVELVEGEGHFEGGCRRRLARLGAEEGYDMVRSGLYVSWLRLTAGSS